MKNKPSRILNWHKHDVVWRSEPLPPSFASNYRKMFLAAMAYNVSSVCDVKNGHTPKFAMKHGFFVFKAEGRKLF